MIPYPILPVHVMSHGLYELLIHMALLIAVLPLSRTPCSV